MTNPTTTHPASQALSSSLPALSPFALAAEGAVERQGGASASQLPLKAWSVSELTQKMRGVLEPQFTQVWVQGEVANYRPAGSGHLYFSLKDQGATLAAAAFGWGSKRQTFEFKNGLQLLCRGKVSIYPPRGNYQLVIDRMEPLGAGALQLAFEQLKAQLWAEGLFAPDKKRKLPRFPSRIVVITSPTGAVLQDMLHILKRRAPHIQIRLIPAKVQGEGAAGELLAALGRANQLDGQLIVLARGGGSIEDLSCFNEEGLARAIAASRLPVISAVGHEIDFTIADFVADFRAPTPSAAAEILSQAWVEVAAQLPDWRLRLVALIQKDLQQKRMLLVFIQARLTSPKDRCLEQAQKVDELLMRAGRAMAGRLQQAQARWWQAAGKLEALSPLKVLERGYVLVKEAGESSGRGVVKKATETYGGQKLELIFADGSRTVEVLAGS